MPSRFPSTIASSEVLMTSRRPSPSASVGWILIAAGAGSAGVVSTEGLGEGLAEPEPEEELDPEEEGAVPPIRQSS